MCSFSFKANKGFYCIVAAPFGALKVQRRLRNFDQTLIYSRVRFNLFPALLIETRVDHPKITETLKNF